MRGLIVIVAIICLLSACSSQYTPSYWDYKSPEHVRCKDHVEMKYCKAYGARMICECIA